MTLLAVAHRAGNSLERLHEATASGADVIEADVQDVRGVLEVHHLRRVGPLPVLWEGRRLHPLGGRRLTLAELLAALPPDADVMLDLKGSDPLHGGRVARALHEHDRERAVLVCGRHWPAMDAFVPLPWARTVLSARKPAELAALRARLQEVPAGRHHGVSVHRSLLGTELVAELHDRVELVMTWPVNDLATLSTVVAHGVSGVICDDLDVLRHVLRTR